jgi:hypothetical protein
VTVAALLQRKRGAEGTALFDFLGSEAPVEATR